MAEHFGGVSPYHVHMMKTRWIMGFMALMIVLLGGGLALSTLNSMSVQDVAQATITPPTPAVVTPTAGILVARQRIESGTQLSDDLFLIKEVQEDLVPPGVVLASEKPLIVGRYSRAVMEANSMVLHHDVSLTEPITPFNIPPGSRAITIVADARTGVEGFAKPSTLVDVLWVYDDKTSGQKNIATIVRGARVVSVAGATQTDPQQNGSAPAQGSFTVTLLTSERDAKAIQLAVASGSLSLSLVGEEEQSSDIQSADTFSQNDLLRTKRPIENPGVCVTRDPSTGKNEKFIFTNNRWEKKAADKH